MGTLQYGADARVDLDDLTLHHLAAVAVAKLRRDEPFLLTWVTASGRESIWIHRSSTLRYVFGSTEQPTLDRALLEAMVRDSSRAGGLAVEAVEPARPAVIAA